MTGKIQEFNTIDCKWTNIFDGRKEDSELEFHQFQTFSHESIRLYSQKHSDWIWLVTDNLDTILSSS